MVRFRRALVLWIVFGCLGLLAAARPERAVIFIIDGLSYKAVDRLPLTNLRALIGRGVYYEKSYNVIPAHPKTGLWARHYSCSIPNPVILAGTTMLLANQKFVQQSFYPKRLTAHVADASSYRSLNIGFNLSFMISRNMGASDGDAVDWALRYTERWAPAFLLIHLQATGSAGHRCERETDVSKPWRHNIWAPGGPYEKAALEVDRQLGHFLEGLRAMHLEDKTLLFVTADHGEADTGGHRPEQQAGWAMPLVVSGPGVQKGKRFPYAEQIDIVPTLCHLMGVEPPRNANGRILAEALVEPPDNAEPRKHLVRELDQVLADGLKTGAAGAGFYGIEQILEWHQMGTLERLIQYDRKALTSLARDQTQ